MQSNGSRGRLGIRIIMAAVFIWTVFLAVGVRFAIGSWWGAGVVLACGLGFLGVWQLVLRLAKRD